MGQRECYTGAPEGMDIDLAQRGEEHGAEAPTEDLHREEERGSTGRQRRS